MVAVVAKAVVGCAIVGCRCYEVYIRSRFVWWVTYATGINVFTK